MFKNLIAGEWVASAHTSRNINPSDTRDLVGEYAQADAAQARTAIAAAVQAQDAWALSTPQQRFETAPPAFIRHALFARCSRSTSNSSFRSSAWVGLRTLDAACRGAARKPSLITAGDRPGEHH